MEKQRNNQISLRSGWFLQKQLLPLGYYLGYFIPRDTTEQPRRSPSTENSKSIFSWKSSWDLIIQTCPWLVWMPEVAPNIYYFFPKFPRISNALWLRGWKIWQWGVEMFLIHPESPGISWSSLKYGLDCLWSPKGNIKKKLKKKVGKIREGRRKKNFGEMFSHPEPGRGKFPWWVSGFGCKIKTTWGNLRDTSAFLWLFPWKIPSRQGTPISVGLSLGTSSAKEFQESFQLVLCSHFSLGCFWEVRRPPKAWSDGDPDFPSQRSFASFTSGRWIEILT